MSILGEIKKTITSFLLEEKGDVTEQSILCLGALVGGAAIASAAHTSSISLSFTPPNKEMGEHGSAHSSCSAHSDSSTPGYGDSYGAGCNFDHSESSYSDQSHSDGTYSFEYSSSPHYND
jgi:hypothetical protein